MKSLARLLIMLVFFACTQQKETPDSTEYLQVKNSYPLARVWSGHPVGFDILTTEEHQFVAYYDKGRNMTVASRSLGDDAWNKIVLPSKVKWDSHNSLVLAVDQKGHLHLSGNMHGVPLIYFKTTGAGNIMTFEKSQMVGRNELHVTYPVFFKNMTGDLFFQYREGSSGDGVTYINRYDADNKTWTRVLNQGLFDGESETNAYPTQPIAGPDGYFHYLWVWRLNPIANTNHNLSYMKTSDFQVFKNIQNENMRIPIMYRERQVIADPVGPWNGLMNSSKVLSFDSENRVLLGYHKFDSDGISQLFIARHEGGRWVQKQISDWPGFTWDINKRGTLKNSIGLRAIKADGEGNVYVAYSHEKYGYGLLRVEEATLQLRENMLNKNLLDISGLPDELAPGMQINTHMDNTGKFLLQWQTLPVNYDRPRSPPYPTPTRLVLYELEPRH